jgi:hypothetical protein
MDNPHPAPVERSFMTSQVVNSHDRLCGPCQAIFIKNNEAGENPYYIRRLRYSGGIAFIASANRVVVNFVRGPRDDFCESQQQAKISRFTTLIPS